MSYNVITEGESTLKRKDKGNMRTKFAVALMKGENESILGIFNTREEADEFGFSKRIPKEAGLHYCFSAPFAKGKPVGNRIKIYSYYNM
jgi:hypothetical protein